MNSENRSAPVASPSIDSLNAARDAAIELVRWTAALFRMAKAHDKFRPTAHFLLSEEKKQIWEQHELQRVESRGASYATNVLILVNELNRHALAVEAVSEALAAMNHRVGKPLYRLGELSSASAHALSKDFAVRIVCGVRLIMHDVRHNPSPVNRFDIGIAAEIATAFRRDRPNMEDVLLEGPKNSDFRDLIETIKAESAEAKMFYRDSLPILGQSHPIEINRHKPNHGIVESGFIGAIELAKALAVHPTQMVAFVRKLERKRRRLDDADWQSVENPRPNTPKYLYRVASQQIRDMASRYRLPKSG